MKCQLLALLYQLGLPLPGHVVSHPEAGGFGTVSPSFLSLPISVQGFILCLHGATSYLTSAFKMAAMPSGSAPPICPASSCQYHSLQCISTGPVRGCHGTFLPSKKGQSHHCTATSHLELITQDIHASRGPTWSVPAKAFRMLSLLLSGSNQGSCPKNLSLHTGPSRTECSAPLPVAVWREPKRLSLQMSYSSLLCLHYLL